MGTEKGLLAFAQGGWKRLGEARPHADPEEGGGGWAEMWRREVLGAGQHCLKPKPHTSGRGTMCVRAEISYTVTFWKGTRERKPRPEGPCMSGREPGLSTPTKESSVASKPRSDCVNPREKLSS